MKNTENNPFLTLRAFCAKHPTLATAARGLVESRSVRPDKDGRFPEHLLRTAALVRSGKINNVKYTADLK
jgi:hypothetical protein